VEFADVETTIKWKKWCYVYGTTKHRGVERKIYENVRQTTANNGILYILYVKVIVVVVVVE
jgi:hypothetical protein